jgi:hypothetical protein
MARGMRVAQKYGRFEWSEMAPQQLHISYRLIRQNCAAARHEIPASH